MKQTNMLFEIDEFKNIPYYLNGFVIYMKDPNPNKTKSHFIPFGRYDYLERKIIIYDRYQSIVTKLIEKNSLN